MKKTCTNLAHPVAQKGETVVINRITYMDLTCTVCGGSQGMRLIRKQK